MSDDREQINIVVSAETKREWKAYADDHPDFSSLTDLIRTCVTRQMHDGYVRKSDLNIGGGGVPEGLDERIGSMEELLASVDDRLHSLEASSDTTPEEIKDLALSLSDALPKLAEAGTPKTAYVAGGTAIDLADSRFPSQIEALTDYANRNAAVGDDREWSEHDVRKALERLVNDFSRVEKTLVGTEPRYYEIDPDNPTETPEGSDV